MDISTKKELAEKFVPTNTWYKNVGYDLSHGFWAFWTGCWFFIEPLFLNHPFAGAFFVWILLNAFRALLRRMEEALPVAFNAREHDTQTLAESNTLPRIDDLAHMAYTRLIWCMLVFYGIGRLAKLMRVRTSDDHMIDLFGRLLFVCIFTGMWYGITGLRLTLKSWHIQLEFRHRSIT
jgi:hypothetical protein